MANKGQKFNKYSNDLKLEVVNEFFNNNKSYLYLEREYNIPNGTIKTWVHKAQNGNDVTSDNRGRPSKNQNIDYKEKYEILKNYQAFLMAQREKK